MDPMMSGCTLPILIVGIIIFIATGLGCYFDDRSKGKKGMGKDVAKMVGCLLVVVVLLVFCLLITA